MNFEEKLLMELKAEMAERTDREPEQARWITGRRMLAGAALLGTAAAAVIAVPLVTGSATPAYALTKQADGSIRIQINEFRDPEKLQADLATQGVTASVTYLEPGKSCANDPTAEQQGGVMAHQSKTGTGDGPVSKSGTESGSVQSKTGTGDGHALDQNGTPSTSREKGKPLRVTQPYAPDSQGPKDEQKLAKDGGADGPATVKTGRGPDNAPVQPESGNVLDIIPANIEDGQTVVLRFKENAERTSSILKFWLVKGSAPACSVVDDTTGDTFTTNGGATGN
jgi:hypothetical protein